MAVSLKASEEGLKEVEQLRREKGWMATDPRWCEAAHTSPKTLTRFRRGKPVQQDTFINICKAVCVAWEDIVDRGTPSTSVSIQWELRIEADDVLKDAIFEMIKKHSGDATLSVRKIEKGSLVFLLNGSLEGFERMEYLFSEGLVTELLGSPMLSVQTRTETEPVRLRNWLQNDFSQLWQPPQLAIASRLPPTELSGDGRFSRLKPIKLGTQATDLTVQLIVHLTPQEEGTIRIAIQVYPAQDRVYLPSGLQLTVVDPVSEFYEIVEAMERDNWVQLEIICGLGEGFQVRLQLDEVAISEDFVV